MKKLSLILFSVLLGMPALFAQTPDALYVATWESMYDIKSEITPGTSDPKLSYNADSQCYEGEILNWAKNGGVSAWNGRALYSFEGDVVTYYGTAATATQLNLNSGEPVKYSITSSSTSIYGGYTIGAVNTNNVENVKVSVNLTAGSVTFTPFEPEDKVDPAKLLSVYPQNNSTIELNDDGSVSPVLTFSGPIKSMMVLCDGENSGITTTHNDDRTEWTLLVSAKVVNDCLKENMGKVAIKVYNVVDENGLPVSVGNNNSTSLDLIYQIKGMTKEAKILFTGVTDVLEAYKSPEINSSSILEIENNTLAFTYVTPVTYMFYAPKDYVIDITSTVSDADDAWMASERQMEYTIFNENTGEPLEVTKRMFMVLTINLGADGGVFTVNVRDANSDPDPDPTPDPDNAVSGIGEDGAVLNVYNLTGVNVMTTDDASMLKNLPKGIYIVNGKKVAL